MTAHTRFLFLLTAYGWRDGTQSGYRGLARALRIDARNPRRWELGQLEPSRWVMDWLEAGLPWLDSGQKAADTPREDKAL